MCAPSVKTSPVAPWSGKRCRFGPGGLWGLSKSTALRPWPLAGASRVACPGHALL